MEKNKSSFEVRDLRSKEKFIVDDQFLNGYAKLVGIYGVGVYISLCRHANKEQKAYPSIGKISEELGISKRSVMRGIGTLEKYNIIKRERLGKQLTNRYYLLDKKEWVKCATVTSDVQSEVHHSHFTSAPQSLHECTTVTSIVRKHNSKETQYEGSNASVAGKEINNLIFLFKEVNPSYERLFSNKTQRAAMERLVKKWGREKIESVIKFLPQIFGKKFAPTITTPVQLENKMGDLISFIKKERSDNLPKYIKL